MSYMQVLKVCLLAAVVAPRTGKIINNGVLNFPFRLNQSSGIALVLEFMQVNNRHFWKYQFLKRYFVIPRFFWHSLIIDKNNFVFLLKDLQRICGRSQKYRQLLDGDMCRELPWRNWPIAFTRSFKRRWRRMRSKVVADRSYVVVVCKPWRFCWESLSLSWSLLCVS